MWSAGPPTHGGGGSFLRQAPALALPGPRSRGLSGRGAPGPIPHKRATPPAPAGLLWPLLSLPTSQGLSTPWLPGGFGRRQAGGRRCQEREARVSISCSTHWVTQGQLRPPRGTRRTLPWHLRTWEACAVGTTLFQVTKPPSRVQCLLSSLPPRSGRCCLMAGHPGSPPPAELLT